MKKTAIIFSLLIFSLLGISAQNNDSENKNRILTQNRKVADFDKIDIQGRFEVKLTQQRSNALSVSAQEKYIENIETYVENGTLIVKMKNPDKNKGFLDKLKTKYSDYTNRQRFEINIGFKNLKAIEMSGASSLSSTNKLNTGKFSLDVSGASNLTLDGTWNDIKIDVSGASSVTMKGTAKNISVEVSGASSFKAAELKCEQVSAEVFGASSAKIYASEKFSGEASGASTIHCYGKPKNVDRDVSGASKIEMNND